MKIDNLKFPLLMAALLSSPLSWAGGNYPAADFQPKVIYQDADQIAKSGASHAASAQTTKPDPKYPAATFQPKVLYNDEGYKPSPVSSSSTSMPTTTTESRSPAVTEPSVSPAKGGSSDNSILVLLGVAVAGAVLFSRRQKGAAVPVQSGTYQSYVGDDSGATGVARYLNRTTGTGVSRYLEKHAKLDKPVTGVSKYMAKQAIAGKANPAAGVTGVEKYMRNRG